MRAGHHEVLDNIILSKCSTSNTTPTTALCPVQVRAGSFRVATGGDRHDDVLFRNEVLIGDLTVPWKDLGSTIIAVLADDLSEFFRDDRTLPRFVGENVVVVGDLRHQIVVLVDDLLAFHGSKTTQLHVEDRRRLQFVDLQKFHQTAAGILDCRTCADQRDNVIECVECLQVTTQDVCAFLGFAEPVARPSLNNLDLVRDPVTKELFQRQCAGDAIHQREHVRTEVVL